MCTRGAEIKRESFSREDQRERFETLIKRVEGKKKKIITKHRGKKCHGTLEILAGSRAEGGSNLAVVKRLSVKNHEIDSVASQEDKFPILTLSRS